MRFFLKCYFILAVVCVHLYFFIDLQGAVAPHSNFEYGAIGARDNLLKVELAKSALNSGLFSIAQTLLETYLQEASEDETAYSEAILLLSNLLIRKDDLLTAESTLSKFKDKKDIRYLIEMAFLQYCKKDYSLANESLKHISEQMLTEHQLFKFLFLSGSLAEAEKKHVKARHYFEKAKAIAKEEEALMSAQISLFHLDIISHKVTEEQAKKIKKKINSQYPLKQENFFLVKEYAIILNKLGKKKEAIKFINTTLESFHPNQKALKNELLLVKALIASPSSKDGLNALKTLLQESSDKALLKAALSLLATRLDADYLSEAFFFLSELASTCPKHPIKDSLMLTQAYIGVFQGKLEASEKIAQEFLHFFPGSKFKEEVLILLGFIAYKKDFPLYRKAADCFAKAIELSTNVEKKSYLTLMVGDCYFLNRDFENAAEIYESLVKKPSSAAHIKSQAFYQFILSYIEANNLEKASLALDSYPKVENLESEVIWQSEWNLLIALKDNESLKEALGRVNKLLTSNEGIDHPMPVSLQVRFLWVKAKLALEANKLDLALATTQKIHLLLDPLQPSQIDSNLLRKIASHSLFLEAQAYLKLNKKEKALELFKTLRKAYPGTDACIESYIEEARNFSLENNYAKAQQILIELTDKYPDSSLCSIALYEAAINSEIRGLVKTYDQALTLLEQLVHKYPNDPLVFYARLKQGNILRKMNNFLDAQTIYEELLKQFPQHPEAHFAELGKIDCLFAQSPHQIFSLKEIAVQYERLYERTSLPANLRLEAGFKAGLTLTKAHAPVHAKAFYWQLIRQFIDKQLDLPVVNQQSKYWLSRSIFELAHLLQEENLIEESTQVLKMISLYQLPGQNLVSENSKTH